MKLNHLYQLSEIDSQLCYEMFSRNIMTADDIVKVYESEFAEDEQAEEVRSTIHLTKDCKYAVTYDQYCGVFDIYKVNQ